MKHIVIGTAGHVDHGKTRLTLALTGKNTDRLAEEQKRGITIEIGFARLTLPNGQTASIVDVPGHERFIRNMLAGASGVDVALMIVAADEGVMPQTIEHLEILSLLGVQNGIIVITKTDLVEEEWLEAIMEETRERMAGSFLADAPMIPVSACTGQGIEQLKAEIVRLLDRAAPRVTDRPFRLPVDRAFSLSGFGAIVTGTLVDGTLRAGQSVMLYPQEKPVRVRELQNHDTGVNEAEAGMRVAVNLTGAEKKELRRGCVLAEPGSLTLSTRIAARLTLNADAPYTVKNSSRLHFYQGTQELLCKVRLLEGDEMLPGESMLAQLTFEEPLAARGLDRFIVRFYSPMTTIGGGVILDMESARLKRNHPETLARLARLEGAPQVRLLQMAEDAGCTLITREALRKRAGLPASQVDAAVDALLAQGSLQAVGGGLAAAAALARAWEAVRGILAAYHAQNPLSPGMHLGELREKAFCVPQKAADAVLGGFAAEGRLRVDGPCAALADFTPSFTGEQRAMQGELSALYEGFGYMPPANDEVAARFAGRARLYEQVFRRMLHDGALVALTSQTAVHRTHYDAARARFVGMFEAQRTVTLAEFRTALGISRKYAQMYLERFDQEKLSKLVGEARVLLSRPRPG